MVHLEVFVIGIILSSLLILGGNWLNKDHPSPSPYQRILLHLPMLLSVGLMAEYFWMILNNCKHLVGWDKISIVTMGLLFGLDICYFGLSQLFKYFESQKTLALLPQEPCPERIKAIWQTLTPQNHRIEIIIVPASIPFACSTGLFKPKIYLSQWLLNYLNDEELKGVLAHEWTHIQKHDAFWDVWNHITALIFRFLPGLCHLKNRLQLEREFLADKRAVQITQNPKALASALLKFHSFDVSSKTPWVGCSHFVTDSVPVIISRIESLIEPNFIPVNHAKNRWYFLFSLILTMSVLVFPLLIMQPQGVCYI